MGNEQSAQRSRQSWPWEQYEEWANVLPQCSARHGDQACMESKRSPWKTGTRRGQSTERWQKVQVPAKEWPQSDQSAESGFGKPTPSKNLSLGQLELQASTSGRHSQTDSVHGAWRRSEETSSRTPTRVFASSASDLFHVSEDDVHKSTLQPDIRRSFSDSTCSPSTKALHDVSLYCTMPNSSRNSLSNREIQSSLYGSASSRSSLGGDRRSGGSRKSQLELSPADRRRCLGDITNSGLTSTRSADDAHGWVYHKVLLSDVTQAAWSEVKSSMLRGAVAAAAGVASSDVEVIGVAERSGRRLLTVQLQVEFRVRAPDPLTAAAAVHALREEEQELEEMLVQAGFAVKKEPAPASDGASSARLGAPAGYRGGYSLEKNLRLYSSQPSARSANPYGSQDAQLGMLM